MVKKIFVFISLFFIAAIPAMADCSMTASNVTYNPSTKVIGFDYTCSDNLSSQNKVTFTDNTQGDWIGQSNSFNDGSNATCTSSHCDATLGTNNIITPVNTDDVFIDIQYINGGTQHADSQIFPYTFDGGGGGGVLGTVTIDPTIQSKINMGFSSLGTIISSEIETNFLPILTVIAITVMIGMGIHFIKKYTKFANSQ